MTEEKTMYTCAICGKSYEFVEDRVDCESKCIVARKKAEEEQARLDRLNNPTTEDLLKQIKEILEKSVNK
jgi:hypothetical protein